MKQGRGWARKIAKTGSVTFDTERLKTKSVKTRNTQVARVRSEQVKEM